MTETVFRFGRREIDVVGREVRIDGRPRPIEPRPFDVLVHLVRQRHRVVPKQELLEQIWNQEPVSVGALARAVMKARQALDDADDAPLIRTVPRVGYRFVASLPEEQAAPASITQGRPSVALLPFDNDTGESALDWVRLGLMSLVARALAQDGRTTPTPTQDVLAAAEGGGRQAAAQHPPPVAQHVVSTRVTRHANGYRLQFRVEGTGGPTEATVHAAQVGDLAGRMADALLQQLFPGASRAEGAAASFRDPMATEAFARGLQAMAEHKWPQAANLFRLALELHPDHPGAQLELLRALAPLADPAGKRLARRLLARAERDNDLLFAARVHQALGRLHLNSGAFAAGAFRIETALRLAGGHETAEWTAETLLLQASVAIHQRQFDNAGRILDELERLCKQSGQRIYPLAALNMRAIIAADCGQSAEAVQISAEVVRRARPLRAHRYLVDACANAMADLIELGRLHEAATFGEEGFSTAVSTGDWNRASGIAPTMGLLYRLARAPQALQRIVATLGEPEGQPRTDGVWTARGHLAACSGEHEEAARCLQRAVALLREAHNPFHEHLVLPWLVDALLRSGRMAEAEAELARADHPPYTQDQPLVAALLHCRARLAHAQGQAQAALTLLQRALEGPITALWRSWASIDAAWLLAEAGEGERALQLLGTLEGPLAVQPAALATLARARWAIGDFQGALAAHQRYTGTPEGSAADDPFAALGAWYGEQAHGRICPGLLPRTACLPCRP